MNKDHLLHIAMVEFSPKWMEVQANLDRLDALEFKKETQLIILPEMFATGFCMQTEQISTQQGVQIRNWMQNYSLKNETAIAGSVAIKENEKFFNRFYLYKQGECIATYDKRHLFSYTHEDKKYETGKEKVIFKFKDWKICPQICYDLRFPVWFRNTEEYDVILNVANWPDSRIHIWSNLLQARSIENMCYTIGVNRKGRDGNDLDYNGKSNVCFPSMENLEKEFIDSKIYCTLDRKKLIQFREKYPFLKDQDNFEIKP